MKKIFLILFSFIITSAISQKSQGLGYIDMDYILTKIPSYEQAKKMIDAKAIHWRKQLEKKSSEIETMKLELVNQKAILTKELIEEHQEDINAKEQILRNEKDLYFGANGNLYKLKSKLIQPIQDQIFNAVQTIAKRKKYDFVFDKSSELVMLYANKKHDISELVLNLLKIDQKKQSKEDKIAERKQLLNKATESSAKKNRKLKIAEIKEKRKKEIEERKKALAEKRKKILEKRAALRKKKLELNKKK